MRQHKMNKDGSNNKNINNTNIIMIITINQNN